MMDKLLSEKHNIKLSKSLSWLLRHNLNLVYPFLESEEEIEVAKTTGFIDCQAILKHHHLRNYSIEQIKEVCTLNDKQRFTIRQHPESPDKMQIRANQGHTINSINVDMKKFQNADEIHHDVIHGTYRKCWPKILKSGGLNKMKRNHIHFAKGLPNDSGVISGMRQNAEVRIYIDVAKAMNAGYEFFESSNGVILCPGDENGTLPSKFFNKVTPKMLDQSGEVFTSSSNEKAADECTDTVMESIAIKHVSKSARKNQKRKEAKRIDKECEYLSKNESSSISTIVEGSNIGTSCRNENNSRIPTTNPEIDRSLRKLNEQLVSIQTLKSHQNGGKQLEKNQIEKIGRENDIILKIQKLEAQKSYD